jgi:hypothetical protein
MGWAERWVASSSYQNIESLLSAALLSVQVLGAGGALDGPAHIGVNNFRFHGAPSSTSTAPPSP